MWHRYPCLRQVIINTRTGHSFRGVLWRKRGGYLVLRQAVMLRERGEVTPVDGELLIEAANVDFIQLVG